MSFYSYKKAKEPFGGPKRGASIQKTSDSEKNMARSVWGHVFFRLISGNFLKKLRSCVF